MLPQMYYPIICTDNYVKTVNFYEDHFNFAPEFEISAFTLLKHKEHDNMYLAVIDKNTDTIPEQYKKTVSGMILNYPVQDVLAAYQQFYWEGLNILSEPEIAPCARKHFFIEDPNGMLIDVAQQIDMKDLETYGGDLEKTSVCAA